MSAQLNQLGTGSAILAAFDRKNQPNPCLFIG